MKKPIVFIIFNRPDKTKVVFETIRKYQPETLFVVADGPRYNKADEDRLCMQTREVIDIDWECNFIPIYASENMGCKDRIISGLNTVFETVDEAIILEDDCVAHESFFPFCENLLDYYRDQENVMVISGNNFQPKDFNIDSSYYFSAIPHCWGWATWKRSWNKMDQYMTHWRGPQKDELLLKYWEDSFRVNYWNDIIAQLQANKIDTWDYQWTLSCWLHNGLTVLPRKNLVSNIGFDETATHTMHYDPNVADLFTHEMTTELKHPELIQRNKEADFYTVDVIYNVNLLRDRTITESKKYTLFKYLLDINNLNQWFNIPIYIFGTGELGVQIKQLLSFQDKKIERFIVSQKSEPVQCHHNIEVIDLNDKILDHALIIVSIEGKHDQHIIENLKSVYCDQDPQVISWKELVRA